MQAIRHLLPVVALLTMSASAIASTTVYTSQSGFLAQLAPGSYTETFDGLDLGSAGPLTFGSGAHAFTVQASLGIDVWGDILSANQVNDALTVSFGAGARAIGGNFFISNFNVIDSVQVTLNLSDGTSVSFTPTSFADSYRGFVSNVDIASITISGPDPSHYASIDNLTVGTIAAVPEPASWALMGLGVMGLLAARRRAAA